MQALFDAAYDLIYTFLNFICSLLDFCPFGDIIHDLSLNHEAFGWLNWLVPVDEILDVLGLWIAALIAYYAVAFVIEQIKKTMQ